MNSLARCSAVLLLLFVAALPARAQTTTTIKLATLVPDGSVWDRILKDEGAKWTQTTEGRVTLRIYPGGVAGDEPDMVRKMRIGQIQAAALTTAGLADIDPAFQVFGIPMFYDSYPEMLSVLRKLEPELRQRLDAKGFVLLHWGHGGWVQFFSKQPIKTLDDLKKSKLFVWAGDDRMVQLWKGKGFQPVALSATDILPGLETGMIDALPTTPLAALSLQWFRKTPYMVGFGLAPLVGGVVVTKAAWNKISEADRAKLLAVSREAETRLEVEVPKQDSTAVSEMSKRGLTVVKLTPDQVSAWRATAQTFAQSMRGGIVPADMLDRAEQARAAFRSSRGGR
jgi:TRAP-type C4-dicarboxylate transport system substrate-binding protein